VVNADLPKAAGRLFMRLQGEMFRQIALAGFADVRPRHGAILAYLVPQGRRLSEFVELTGQHKQVIGTIADELETLGYVTREPDPTDRRAKLLVPTERGLEELAAATRIIDRLERRIADEIGIDAVRELQKAMLDAADALR
jgi:DNA-binding MarR family transcriptional regulator